MLKEAVKHLDANHPKKSYRDQDVILLLKLIVLDEETDLKKITSKTLLNQAQVERYLRKKEVLCNYLSDEEYNEYLKYYNNLNNFNNEIKNEKKEKKISNKQKSTEDEQVKSREMVANIITDIMESRLSRDKIAEKYYTSVSFLEKTISNVELIDGMYGEGFSQILNKKLLANGYVRQSVPKTMYLIEERNDIAIGKSSFIYLNEFDFKRLKVVSHFIFNGYDIDLTAKFYEVKPISIYNVLSNPKNQYILNSEVYEYLKKITKIQKLMFEGSFTQRKEFLDIVLSTLEKNNYDVMVVSDEMGIPVNIIKRFLKDDLVDMFYKTEQITKVNEILKQENEIIKENGNQKK